jgi:hypothetical protein
VLRPAAPGARRRRLLLRRAVQRRALVRGDAALRVPHRGRGHRPPLPAAALGGVGRRALGRLRGRQRRHRRLQLVRRHRAARALGAPPARRDRVPGRGLAALPGGRGRDLAARLRDLAPHHQGHGLHQRWDHRSGQRRARERRDHGRGRGGPAQRFLLRSRPGRPRRARARPRGGHVQPERLGAVGRGRGLRRLRSRGPPLPGRPHQRGDRVRARGARGGRLVPPLRRGAAQGRRGAHPALPDRRRPAAATWPATA